MNLSQIERLVASVPETVEDRQLARVHGYAAAARCCERRITALRSELEQAQRTLAEASVSGAAEEQADRVLDITRELDSLERVQPRIDAWLRVAVAALSDDPFSAPPFGEGPA